ncbi:ABC transporter ATP-binding protein [Frankia sp. AgB1.9]|uniref:ABC transporter ATP-binding protein n=1 Tax=unclassified Frankia TaxID=2632575 RepID=UPI001931D5C9|nr:MULTISPECIES: ABC transporter ATP-binding protein [unclassified Frankia]MBL7487328.1 ABC transporter ATP-binding protein [Frankia sp. AgW1.1]MBL7546336.1 ABC transporter ATP-binding protein [Frankia sp. AgB1.9]MBL7618618.1 ABC transporter ATP-binding protein [Frankia sp. AgB1.8]
MATSDVPDTSDASQVPAQRDPTPATTPAESLEDQPGGSAPDPEVRAAIPHDPVLTYGKEDDDTSSAWRKHEKTMERTGVRTMVKRLPGLLRLAWSLAWEADRNGLIALVTVRVVAGLVEAAGLLAVAGALSGLLTAGPTPDRVRHALPALALILAAGLVRTALSLVENLLRARFGPRIDRVCVVRLLDLATTTSVMAFDDPRFVDDLEAAERGAVSGRQLVDNATTVFTSVVRLVAAAGVLGVLHPLLVPLLILSILPDGWATARSARLAYASWLGRIRLVRRQFMLRYYMIDRDSAAEIRSFGLGRFLLDEYSVIARGNEAEALRVGRGQARYRLVGESVAGLALGAVYGTLVVLLDTGVMPLAAAGAAVLAIRNGRGALSTALSSLNDAYENFLYFDEYQAWILEATRRIPPSRSLAAPVSPDVIRVDGVTYTYPHTETTALRGVSVELRRGQVVAFVGANGSGKSTLAKVLAGLYVPDSGTVRWDGVDLAGVDPDSVRDRVGLIPQVYTRWPMSARLNIAVGRVARLATDGPDSVIAAAAATGADEVIDKLPHGYDTSLARQYNSGHDLSGGQWQRIACARAVYRDAPILIADEPSAALDARAEQALFDLIQSLGKDRIVLLITHRLASVRTADRIYVLDDGLVADEGTHAELMNRPGIYPDLFTLQARQFVDTIPVD